MGTGARTAEVRIIKIDRGHYQVSAIETTKGKEEHLGGNDVHGTKDVAEDMAQAAKDGLLDEGYDEVWVREV